MLLVHSLELLLAFLFWLTQTMAKLRVAMMKKATNEPSMSTKLMLSRQLPNNGAINEKYYINKSLVPI